MTRARSIRLGTALGVGAAGASVIAACGGGEANRGGGTIGGVTEAATTGGGAEEATQATAEPADAETEGGEPTRGDRIESGQDAANAIARERDVPPGSAVQFAEESGQPAVLVHLEGGESAAYSAVCTHAR